MPVKPTILTIVLLIMFVATASSPVHAQTGKASSQPIYALVHGAWGGSWAFRRVDSLLTARGNKVYRPALTGQGKRVHLASPAVGLSTHINDGVNILLFEDLHNVILVGHSYGGWLLPEWLTRCRIASEGLFPGCFRAQ